MPERAGRPRARGRSASRGSGSVGTHVEAIRGSDRPRLGGCRDGLSAASSYRQRHEHPDRSDRRTRRSTPPSGSAPASTASRCSGRSRRQRAGDFLSCPLLYRFRTIDRLPEPPRSTPSAAPSCTRCSRTSSTCRRPTARPSGPRDMVVPAWEAVLEAEPALATLFPDQDEGAAVGAWLTSCRDRARALLHAGGPAPARARRPRALRREPHRHQAPAARRRSTGSTWRPTARSGWSTTRRAGRPRGVVRGQGAVPAEVLRAGHLADARRAPQASCS